MEKSRHFLGSYVGGLYAATDQTSATISLYEVNLYNLKGTITTIGRTSSTLDHGRRMIYAERRGVSSCFATRKLCSILLVHHIL